MNVLVIGGGGREHAIITALAKSKKVDKLYAAPAVHSKTDLLHQASAMYRVFPDWFHQSDKCRMHRKADTKENCSDNDRYELH